MGHRVRPCPLTGGGCCLQHSVCSWEEAVAIFTQHPFLPQEAEIDSIHQLVVGATENIKEGNEDIREVGALGSPGCDLVQYCLTGGAAQELWGKPRAHEPHWLPPSHW